MYNGHVPPDAWYRWCFVTVWGAEGTEGVCGVPAEVCLAPGAWTHVVLLHDSHVISPELDPPRPREVSGSSNKEGLDRFWGLWTPRMVILFYL